MPRQTRNPENNFNRHRQMHLATSRGPLNGLSAGETVDRSPYLAMGWLSDPAHAFPRSLSNGRNFQEWRGDLRGRAHSLATASCNEDC